MYLQLANNRLNYRCSGGGACSLICHESLLYNRRNRLCFLQRVKGVDRLHHGMRADTFFSLVTNAFSKNKKGILYATLFGVVPFVRRPGAFSERVWRLGMQRRQPSNSRTGQYAPPLRDR